MSIAAHNATLAINGSNVVQLRNITLPNFSREAVDAYHLGETVAKTRPSRVGDPGEASFEINYDPTLHATLYALRTGVGDSTFAASLPGFGIFAFSGWVMGFEHNEMEYTDTENFSAVLNIKANSLGVWSS